MSSIPLREFDVTGPLPTGVTLLEASAGTGKTFTITALAARYIAEGVPPERILMMTYTRFATGELRDRVRRRLVQVRDELGRARARTDFATDDGVVRVLATGSAQEIVTRWRNIDRAIAQFDALAISTTLGFCQGLLFGLGVGGDITQSDRLLSDSGEYVARVADDVLLAMRLHEQASLGFTYEEAQKLANAVVDGQPFARIVPEDPGEDPQLAQRVAFAHAVRKEFARRTRREGRFTYNDLQGRMHDLLGDAATGVSVASEIARAYDVVLVDEFQDTDPVQWRILEQCFGATASLVLIGDPKQAIYGFRGADVRSYLAAGHRAETRATLATSWRSTPELLRGLDILFAGASLGADDIVYRPLRAARTTAVGADQSSLTTSAVRMRVLSRDVHQHLLGDSNLFLVSGARDAIARDLVADIAQRLADPHGCRMSDIAVLVRKKHQAMRIHKALSECGISAVISQGGNVFTTPMARQWAVFLRALETPSARRVNAAALTVFLGWTADQLTAADDHAWDELYRRLAEFRRTIAGVGVAALLTRLRAEGLAERLLSRPDGMRNVIDLEHIGELLHAAVHRDEVAFGGMLAWLGARMRMDAEDERQADAQRQRIATDRSAVNVMTIHASKGLEFPVVYYPYLWEGGERSDSYPVFHDDDADGKRVIAVGGRLDPLRLRNSTLATHEARDEELRVLYVALTRARDEVVVWWAASRDTHKSPLARMLAPRDDDGHVPRDVKPLPSDEDVVDELQRRAGPDSMDIAIEMIPRERAPIAMPARAPAPELVMAATKSPRNTSWRRYSYSQLTHADDRPGTSPLRDDLVRTDDDRDLAIDVVIGGPHHQMQTPVPLAGMPAGTSVGTMIHSVYEHADFASPTLDEALITQLTHECTRTGVIIDDVPAIARGLAASMRTPFGGVFGELCLRDIPSAARRTELGFEFPLTGGDVGATRVRVQQIADILAAFGSSDDVARAYAPHLHEASFANLPLHGFFTGVIDALITVPSADGPSYGVVDYKTNWLGPRGGALTIDCYAPDVVANEMYASHYPLQALCYLVAVHRLLRWRVPDYSVDRHIAGAAYLFVRGMVGPETPLVDGKRYGVWTWRPSSGVIAAVSDALDEGGR
jgi:exodeoxyribonuclease V beta subunit